MTCARPGLPLTTLCPSLRLRAPPLRSYRSLPARSATWFMPYFRLHVSPRRSCGPSPAYFAPCANGLRVLVCMVYVLQAISSGWLRFPVPVRLSSTGCTFRLQQGIHGGLLHIPAPSGLSFAGCTLSLRYGLRVVPPHPTACRPGRASVCMAVGAVAFLGV